mmetsp:Transcript_78607/g.172331  ORF Transcript_78607/g.172331 Transcript_78607/m.172331 type:complete len:204 (+) Transcript_78607:42-653(+)
MMRSTPAKKRSDVYWGSSALADDAGKFRGHDLTYAKRNLDGMYECESPTPQNAYNKKKEAMSSRSGCSDRKGFGVIQKVWLAHLADCSVVACQATCQCQLELGRCQELGARAWIVDRLASDFPWPECLCRARFFRPRTARDAALWGSRYWTLKKSSKSKATLLWLAWTMSSHGPAPLSRKSKRLPAQGWPIADLELPLSLSEV